MGYKGWGSSRGFRGLELQGVVALVAGAPAVKFGADVQHYDSLKKATLRRRC